MTRDAVILAAAVRMERVRRCSFSPLGVLERLHHQLCRVVKAESPPHNLSRVEVNDGRKVEEETVIEKVGEVSCPNCIGRDRTRSLDAVRDIGCPFCLPVAWCSASPPRSHSVLAHDAEDGVLAPRKHQGNAPVTIMGMVIHHPKDVCEERFVLRCLLGTDEVES